MSGMLYLVPTPIGNLGDISQRCAQTLAQAFLGCQSYHSFRFECGVRSYGIAFGDAYCNSLANTFPQRS